MIAGVASPAQDHVISADELGMLGSKQDFPADGTITKPHETCMVFKASTRHRWHLVAWPFG
jgi:hypothetical protein